VPLAASSMYVPKPVDPVDPVDLTNSGRG